MNTGVKEEKTMAEHIAQIIFHANTISSSCEQIREDFSSLCSKFFQSLLSLDVNQARLLDLHEKHMTLRRKVGQLADGYNSIVQQATTTVDNKLSERELSLNSRLNGLAEEIVSLKDQLAILRNPPPVMPPSSPPGN